MRTTDPLVGVGSKRKREPSQQQSDTASAVSFPDSKRIALADVTNQSQTQQSRPEAVKVEHEQVVPSSTNSEMELIIDVDASADLHSSSRSTSSASLESDGGSAKPRQFRLAAPRIRRGRTRRFIDIDAKSTDPAECATYCKDIFRNLFHQERQIGRDYMREVQTDITDTMRAILLDWLVEVVAEYALSIESLFLARAIVDRVLERERLERCKLQLLGIAAVLIASKFEDIHAPPINEFVYISENSYTRSAIIAMETHVLNVLEFNLTIPTEMQFLPRLLKAATCEMNNCIQADRVTIMAHFLCELTLSEYAFIQFTPSTIALSAVCLALCAMGLDPWNQTLEHYSGHTYSEPAFRSCFVRLHATSSSPPAPQVRAVRCKYDSTNFHRVSQIAIGALPAFPAQRTQQRGLQMSREQQQRLLLQRQERERKESF